MTPRLMNAKELCAALGISVATYQRHRKLGVYRRFEVHRPVGTRRYSAVLVDAYLRGEHVGDFGSLKRRSA